MNHRAKVLKSAYKYAAGLVRSAMNGNLVVREECWLQPFDGQLGRAVHGYVGGREFYTCDDAWGIVFLMNMFLEHYSIQPVELY